MRLLILALLCGILAAGRASAMEFRPVALPEPGQVALLMQGEIEPGDADRLRALRLPAGQRITLVVLNSPGGAVLAGRDMARFLRAKGVPVLVPRSGVCASACFLLFAAGREKLAQPGARIGVHSASVTGGRESIGTLGVTTLMAREAAAYGVPPAITGRMVTTQPGDMAWLSEDELRLMGVRIVGDAGVGGQIGSQIGAPGAATVSDWSRGFTFGESHANAACTPPAEVGNAGDWTLGCRSGQTSVAQVGSGLASGGPGGAGQSDWSRGFDDGLHGGDCGVLPADVGNRGDYALGCASGRKAR
jgi:hypothetical protein